VAQTKLQATGLRMEYYQPRTGGRLLALDNVNLSVEDGEFVSIVGPRRAQRLRQDHVHQSLRRLTQTDGR